MELLVWQLICHSATQSSSGSPIWRLVAMLLGIYNTVINCLTTCFEMGMGALLIIDNMEQNLPHMSELAVASISNFKVLGKQLFSICFPPASCS
jgi:hypothetical protein